MLPACPYSTYATPGFHIPHIRKGNLVSLCMNVFFCTSAFFSLPAAGRFSCCRLRGAEGARLNTTACAWSLAKVRGTCSGGSKSQVTMGRHSEYVEPSRPMQTHVQVKNMCDGSCCIWGLECRNVVRHYLVMERYFPDTNLRDIQPLLVL